MKNKCRCYINAKTYAKQASKGTLKKYVPCPIHEMPDDTFARLLREATELKYGKRSDY